MTTVSHQLSGLVFALLALNLFFAGAYSYQLFLILLFFALLGAIFPDIDEPNSYIGRRTYIISKLFKFVFGHRGFTHSLAGMIFFTVILGVITSVYFNLPYSVPLFFGLGYLSHLLGDLLTSHGIPLFSPFMSRRYSLSFFSTGSGLEYFFRIVLGVIFLHQFYLYYVSNFPNLFDYIRQYSL